jgi:acetyl esterase/lipase
VPARLADVKGLPPAFIGVGTLDLFYDEDVAYAGALTVAGVPVDLVVVPAAFHAFDGVAPLSRASKAFTARWLRDLSAAIAA